jgi:SAM-dependent methyltransferase
MFSLEDLERAIYWRNAIDLERYPSRSFSYSDGIIKYHFIYNQIINYSLKKQSRILDIGSGDSQFSRYISDLGHQVLAIDILGQNQINNISRLSPGYYLNILRLKLLSKRNPNFKFKKMNFEDLCETNKFDVVYDSCSLIHMAKKTLDFKKLLVKVKNHIAPGGFFIMVCDVSFNGISFKNEFYSENELGSLIESTGFKRINTCNDSQSPLFFFGHTLYENKPLVLGVTGFVLQSNL